MGARGRGEGAGRGGQRGEGNRPSEWLFRDERDHQAFMERLVDRVETYNIRLHAHCEMRTHYHAFVEHCLAEEDGELLSVLKGPCLAIGDETFVDDIRSRTIELIGTYKRREDVSLRHVVERLDAEKVLAVAGAGMGVDPMAFRMRRRNSVLRGVAARMLCKHGGLTQREAAGALGVASGAAVGRQQQKLTDALVHDRSLRRRVTEIEARLTALRQS